MFNAQSVASKLLELQYIMYNTDIDCIFVTESWLHEGISDGIIDPRGLYAVIRKDRVGVRGGGVCVLVRRKYHVLPMVFDGDYRELEMVGVTFLDFYPNLDVFTVYRPPKRDCDAKRYMNLLISCLSAYISNAYGNIHFIVGDLNLPHIEWNLLTCSGDTLDDMFLEFTIQNSLSQLVTFPTRCHNVLDLVLTDIEQSVVHVDCQPPIGGSDHVTIDFVIALTPRNSRHVRQDPVVPSQTCRYQWHRADYDCMYNYLSAVDWPSVLCYNPEVSQFWDAYNCILKFAVSEAVPITCHNGRATTAASKCDSRDVRKCVSLKRKLWRDLADRPWDSLLRQKYRDCVYRHRRALSHYHASVEERLISNNNLGAFYRYVNRRISGRTGVGVIVNNGFALTDDVQKADAFNHYFASVGIVDDGLHPNCVDVPLRSILDHVTVAQSEVMSSIDKLKGNSSAGPDGFPPAMYKHLKECLSGPLTTLYNQFLSVGYVPSEWHTAHIVPVHKKGVTGDVGNYRPISLTCVTSKILERIVVNRILEHLNSNDILHPAQHGFVKQRSTCTNLLESLNDWTLSVQTKQQITVVYIDFSKAFDVVSHNKLFARLYSYGIRGTVLLWIKNFLSGRTHQTKVGSAMSDIAQLLSGVVQGSGVGPCMFLIYINELIVELAKYGITVKAFADDVKMYVQIIDDLDVRQLQLAVDVLCGWAKTWQLSISVNKCCVLNIGRQARDVTVSIDGDALPIVDTARDLGVVVTKDLSSSAHVNDVVSRAHKRAAAILRTFVSQDVNLLMRAFITYVRPIVEYNSVVWSPSSAHDIDAVERVQRRFTKRLPGLKNMSYDQRMKILQLPSLELRRKHADLFWCYKIVFGLVLVQFDKLFVMSPNTVTRGHKYKLFKRHSNVCIRSQFFTERVLNTWNNLPSQVDFSSFSRFKRSVKRTKFDGLRY